MADEKRTLNVNCGFACLLNDRQGLLDSYDRVQINCGSAIISTEMNAKIIAKGGMINGGDIKIRDIKGEILQLDAGTVIDGRVNLKDLFVIVRDSLIIRGEGMQNIAEAEGVIVLGTVYYPESGDISCLVKVSGEKQAYADDAQVILGNQTLERLMSAALADKKHLWVSGRVTALDKKTLENAKSRGIRVTCASLFTYEGFSDAYGDLFQCADRTLVPDGHEITGDINSAELPLYGPRIYVDGKFSMDERDLPALKELESIIVKGRAELPSSTVKTFREKGKAGSYLVFEGRLQEINGFEQFSHSQLAAGKGEKITLMVNGCLLFDDDVTAEDMESIASLSYNGTVLAPGAAKAALALKVKNGNGFMGDPAALQELTGKSLKELARSYSGADSDAGNNRSTNLNTGTYMLV